MTLAQSFTMFSSVLFLALVFAVALGVRGINLIAAALHRKFYPLKFLQGFILLIAAVIFSVNTPTLVTLVLRPLMPAPPATRAAALHYCESHIYSRFIACMEALHFSVTTDDR